MTQDEIKYYLADTKTKRDIDLKKKEESEFDSDLNRTMYQEYWTDLKEFKPKSSRKESHGKKSGQLQRKTVGFSGRTAASVSHASSHVNISQVMNSARTPRGLNHGGASLSTIGNQLVAPMGGMTPRVLHTNSSIDGGSHNNLPSIFQRSNPRNFLTEVRDPNQSINNEINPQYIVPKIKFDTIFDEYMDKRKQFDHIRSNVNKPDGDA